MYAAIYYNNIILKCQNLPLCSLTPISSVTEIYINISTCDIIVITTCILIPLDIRNLIECREDFYLGEDGLCRAECGKFEYWPHHIEDIFNLAFTVALVVGITVGVVVIAVSCIQHKKL